ncbi:MAG: ABC transporter substrate-binding protein [Syntrophomonas sp.]
MKKFVALLLFLIMGVAALSGCSSQSETARKEVYKIAIVQPMDHPSLNQIRETIVSELQAQGMGDKVEIITKNANGDMNLLPSIMQDLINSKVNMIVPIATPAAQAAKSSTTTVPIVFSAVSNPVAAGLVRSFDATTGNITGVSNSIPIEDIFKLAAAITPQVKTYGFVYNAGEINSTSGIERAKAYCDKNGIKYKEATITGTADIQQSAASLIGKIDAFFTPNDNTVASAMATYVQVATDAKLPIYAGADSMVKEGALATVGIDYTKLGKQTAAMIIRIFNGKTIAETPVEQVAEYANMININTANKLGLTISDELKQESVILDK